MTPERPSSVGERLLSRLGSADVYVQKLDLARDVALLIEFERNAYRSASFLDDRILSASTKGGWIALGRLIEAARAVQDARPLHFIFHTGHVGSTLVSRLLDETDAVLSLREPLTLRLLAEAHDVVAKPESLLSAHGLELLVETFLRLWSRGYAGTNAVIVKATSSAGRIAPALLARRSDARAIYMNLRPEPYLATLLAGQNSPTDLRGHGPERVRRLQTFGVTLPRALHQMSLGEMAAMSWLAETWSQDNALRSAGARVIGVDFDLLLTNVPTETARIVRHLGLPDDPQFLSSISASPALTRYAKAPEHAYTPQLRAQILADSRARHGEEIRKGMTWLEKAADAYPRAADILNRVRS